MHADDLAPIPGAGERIVDRRGSFGYGRDRGGDARRVERASFERALGRLGANRRRRHRAERDAHADGAAAARRQMRSERDHGAALRLDARNLAIAKRVRAGRALEGNRKHQPARLSTTRGKELLDRHVAHTISAL